MCLHSNSKHTCGKWCEKYAPVIGRVLIANLFLGAGISKIFAFAQWSGIVGSALPMPEVMTVLAIILEVGGGLSLLLGYRVRLGALALIGFTAATSIFFHPFWSVAPELKQDVMVMFMKNLAIIGGLLYVHVYGAGAWSFDKKCCGACGGKTKDSCCGDEEKKDDYCKDEKGEEKGGCCGGMCGGEMGK